MIDNVEGRLGNDRGTFEATANLRIDWVNDTDWCNYTRNFPAGDYQAWAALSFDGRAAGQLHGTLQLVTSDPMAPNQTVQQLGIFDAPGSGGWGRNELVQMKDAGGTVALVHLEGTKTVRFT